MGDTKHIKKYITMFLVLAAKLCFANMASPYSEGTKVSSVFSSRDIDILNEQIQVTIDRKFEAAAYVVQYNISTDTDGLQIPLLFYAVNYKSDFKVWVDGKAVQLLNIPARYTDVSNSPFQNFAGSLDELPDPDRSQTVTVYWQQGLGRDYKLSDLKYFEAILKKGKHQVRVEYTAGCWEYRGNWIKQYSFVYSLSPARNWRSFGGLQINVNAQNFKGHFTTDLGVPNNVLGTTQTWKFNQLPGPVFTIFYTPKVSGFSSLMLFMGPFGIALSITVFLIFFHLVFIIKSRRAKPLKKYSPVTIIGSLLIPLVFFIVYLFSFGWIDSLIGGQASQYHGYPVFYVILYPFIVPLYWLIMWLTDRQVKKKALSSN